MLKSITRNKTYILLSLLVLGAFLFLQFRFDLYLQFNPDGQLLTARVQELITLFLSIIIEAFPFIILGIFISIAVELFVKSEWLLKILPKNPFLNRFVISLFGFLMPVCECGNIPVARRLIAKNFTVSQAVTFLLAAPILNPVTLWATFEAFSPDRSLILVRIIGALVISNLVGWIISFKKNQTELLTDKFYAEVCENDEHEHSKIDHAIEIFINEFWTITKLLCIGAFLAAVSQIFIPREVITSIGQNEFLSIIAMMLFAFVISICSNVDAFVVLPYTSTFSLGAISSYLVFGPMIDMKILTMLRSSFKTNLLVTITVLVTLLSILIGLIVNFLI